MRDGVSPIAEVDLEKEERRGVEADDDGGAAVALIVERKGDLKGAEALVDDLVDDLKRVLELVDLSVGDAEDMDGAEREGVYSLFAFKSGVLGTSSLSFPLNDAVMEVLDRYGEEDVAAALFVLLMNGERNGVESFWCCFR